MGGTRGAGMVVGGILWVEERVVKQGAAALDAGRAAPVGPERSPRTHLVADAFSLLQG